MGALKAKENMEAKVQRQRQRQRGRGREVEVEVKVEEVGEIEEVEVQIEVEEEEIEEVVVKKQIMDRADLVEQELNSKFPVNYWKNRFSSLTLEEQIFQCDTGRTEFPV